VQPKRRGLIMKIQIVLNGTGGELDRQTIDVRDDDDSAEISHQILEAIEAWVLSPGDTITIKEQ
jgi:hypothetical protein